MHTELNFQGLIDYFERRANRVEKDMNRYRHGDGPRFPPFFVFLGTDATRCFAGIARELLRLWPQYGDTFRFVGACYEDGSSLHYSRLKIDSQNEVSTEALTEDELSDELSSLYAYEDIYRMTMLDMYFILDTSSVKSVEEFEALVEIVSDVHEALQLDNADSRCSLCVLLNSSLRTRVIAKQIRRWIAEMSEHLDDARINNVFLLSNHRNDGRLLPTWDECYRIVCLYIALSNCDDHRIVSKLYNNRVLTASYAVVRKPVRDIGQVCLDVLLRGVSTYGTPANRDLLTEEGVKDRLGITEDGTFGVIDDSAVKVAQTIVPSEQQLCYFPQDEYRDYTQLASFTFTSFDEACMGALSAYLEIEQRTHLVVDGVRKSEWAKDYGELLRNNFSIDELIYLGNHIQKVRSLFHVSSRASRPYGVIEGAIDRLRRGLSQNEQVVELLVGQIKEESERAQSFRALWHNLLDSLVEVREVKDEALVTFYERMTSQFLRSQGPSLGKRFAEQATTDQLSAFLEQTIDELIDSDPVFSAPFDSELMQRLNAVNDGADWFEWIYSNLTGEHLQTYLQVNFALDDPLVKGVFAEEGTTLTKRLRGALSSQSYFYNTGSGHWVEAINVYAVDAGNLSQ